jgi:dGTPase
VPDRAERRYGPGNVDQRNAFQRDRDRILYSTALRRLAGITQVVGAAEGHVVHNRLTHSLEVAQLARRLAEKLTAEQSDIAQALGGIDPDVTEAAGLVHDIGHPPFGHVAETELDHLMTNVHDVDDGFEGNAQTFRTVTKLSVRHVDYAGQNLTAATLNAVLKYPRFRGSEGFERKKFGSYRSESEDFHWARGVQPVGAEDEKSPEAEIMDWADDIAYAVHDMEDFYRAGFVPLERLMDEDNEEADRFVGGTFDRWGRDFRPVRDHTDAELRDAFLLLLEQLRETQQIDEPYVGTREQRANLRSLTSLLITRYVRGADPDDPPFRFRLPDGQDRRTVAIRSEAEREITMLKQLTWFYVIQRPSLAGQQLGQQRIIRELFEDFYAATESVTTRDRLPGGARESLEAALQAAAASGPQGIHSVRARTAADVICGLSEQQAIGLHQRLRGFEPGSVFSGLGR